MDRIVEAIRRYWTYGDVAVIFLGGLVASAVGIFGDPDPEQLTQAALAVMSVLGITLLHDRVSRERKLRAVEQRINVGRLEVADAREELDRLVGRLSSSVDAVRRCVQEIEGPHPYHVISIVAKWDIEDGTPTGSATATRVKDLRFVQNDVIAFKERARTEGHEQSTSIRAGVPEDESLIELTPARSYVDERGLDVSIVALNRPWQRGETLRVVTERILGGAFHEEEEYVTLTPHHPTERVTLSVHWPRDRPPRRVQFIRTAMDRRGERIDITTHVTERDGRAELAGFLVEDPSESETLKLEWTW